MNPVRHVAASGVISAVFALWTRSLSGTVACFLSGVLIDIDHLFDYWAAKKNFSFDYQKLFSFCAFERQGRLTLIFHSFEFLAAFWLAILYFRMDIVWVGVAIGMSAHMFLDQVSNPLKPLALFFVYRLKHKFLKQSVFPDDYYEKMI